MPKIKLFSIFVSFFLLSACFPSEYLPETAFSDEGKVIIYLQPLSQESSRLRFIIDKIFAVRDDGLQFPLSQSIHELKRADLAGLQKRLAWGHLPEGSYTGISIKVIKAFLEGEEGESALLVPEEPVPIVKPFKVLDREALALFLTFNAQGAVTRGASFTPKFSLKFSERGLTSLIGYVSNSGSDTISVFNKKTMRVTGTIATGRRPKGMVLDQERRRVYVAASGDDSVEVIDIMEGKIIDRIDLNFGDEPVDLALSPDGRTLVSVNYGSNTVSIIDAISELETRRVRVGERPVSAVMDPLGVKAYVMSSVSNILSVVDLSQEIVSVNIGVEGSPSRGDFNFGGDRLYIINTDSPNLSVIDPAQLIEIEKIFIGLGAISIKFDARTGLLLIGKNTLGEIAVIDPFSSSLIDTIGIEGQASFLTIDDEENGLLVVLPDVRKLEKINLTSKKIMGEIEVGEEAYAVVVMGER